jgi:hypothetical protein
MGGNCACTIKCKLIAFTIVMQVICICATIVDGCPGLRAAAHNHRELHGRQTVVVMTIDVNQNA